MKYLVIFLVLIGLSGTAFAQYLGGVEFYHLPLTVESKQYSVLAQSNTNYFTGVAYDRESNSLIFSTSVSEDFIDTYTITMNEQTFSELLATDYAKTPDSMLILIDGVEQPYKTIEDDKIISWRFYVPSSSNEVEIIHSTPMFGTGTYKFDKIPNGSPKIYPPLKQNHIGIVTGNIQCKDDLVLVQKYDGSPACVTESAKQKLSERGWTGTNQIVVDHFRNLSEVVAFYEVYEDVEFLLNEDHISYFSGSDDGYFVRMNLFFDENYSIKGMDFHCYFQRIHQYEFAQEDIASNIKRYDCHEHGKMHGSTPESKPESISEFSQLPRNEKRVIIEGEMADQICSITDGECPSYYIGNIQEDGSVMVGITISNTVKEKQFIFFIKNNTLSYEIKENEN